MIPKVLLLDCSSALAEKLKRQGFDIDWGTIGFASGVKRLPSQIYEKDILVYNPFSFRRNVKGYISDEEIRDITEEYGLEHLRDHILKGATMIVFVNRVSDEIEQQRRAYYWIPFMPKINFTKDNEPLSVRPIYDEFLQPLVDKNDLKIPIMQKLKISEEQEALYRRLGEITGLFFNKNGDVLGLYMKIGEGRLIILPSYNSNDDTISTFLHRVMPKIYNLDSHANITERFQSPEEITAQSKIEEMEVVLKKATDTLGEAKEQLETAKRDKINTIKSDETAVLILSYFETATQQDDVALFYLYKIIERLEKQYGRESEAKGALGFHTEWNLVGKLANESYGDMRHAPKPGEKVKEWTPDEIKSCFEAVEKITYSYLKTLF